jgi:hypothetical protein
MNPKDGTPHKTTIIFYHDYGYTNEEFFRLFADPYNKDSFAQKTSRIVLPLAPEIKISALRNHLPDTKRAWFNVY